MLITKIELQRRHPERVNIYIDDEYALSVNIDVVTSFGLHTGDRIEQDMIETLKLREEFHLAKSCALRFLTRRVRSTQEIRMKLFEKEFDPAIIEDVVRHLHGSGLLNDRRFAQAFVHDLQLRKPCGRRFLLRQLRMKGVPSSVIEETLSEALTTDQERDAAFEAATALLQRFRTSRRNVEAAAQQRRIAQYLARRGFGWDTIIPVIRKVFQSYPSLPLE